jgi:hypothetical protein
VAQPARPLDPVRAGRLAMTALFWVLTIYVIGAGLVSVVPQIFAGGDCEAEIRGLRRDLLSRAAAAGEEPPDRAGAWLDAWDGRYRALPGPCRDHPTYPALGRLRDGIERDLEALAQDPAPPRASPGSAPDR